MKIGLLASGRLGYEVLEKLCAVRHLEFVMTDSKSEEIIEFCIKRKLPQFIGNPRNGKCDVFIENKNIDVLISVNYLFIIEKKLIDFPRKVAFNIHGSLLPKYRGRTPHVWAIINNEREAGVTAHLIDTGCDTGAIIEQIKVPIEYNDTGADVLNKYRELYYPLVNSVLDKVQRNEMNYLEQNNSLATYFGKRAPEHGHIDWNWQKERIRNWVRAQAFPYPGAFAFLDGRKVTIDKIIYNDSGFNYDMPNGMVLSVEPLLVKTPNGVIEITQLRAPISEMKSNSILN